MTEHERPDLEAIRERVRLEGYYVTERNDIGERYDVECEQAQVDVTALLAYIERLEVVRDIAADFVMVVNEDFDMTKPIVMPGEFDALEDALNALGDG